MKNTKVYLMSTGKCKRSPELLHCGKEFLPKEHWAKTVAPTKRRR